MLSPFECAAMLKHRLLLPILSLPLWLAACGDRPLIYGHEDEKPAYEQGSAGTVQAESRAPLDVPPDLRGELEVPMPESIAVQGEGQGGARIEKEAVAGKAVSLDARVYEAMPDKVFSAVVDAMTALNLPVASVDSPSGTVTTEWIRQGADNPNIAASALDSLFGGGPSIFRYRYVVRVLRQGEKQTQLQIRTLGQAFISRHWVNKPIRRKVSADLFAAVEEQLARTAPPAQPQE